MKSPCHECTRHTAIPNCHAECEEYKAYDAYRQRIREARQFDHAATAVRIDVATKIRNEIYRKRRK